MVSPCEKQPAAGRVLGRCLPARRFLMRSHKPPPKKNPSSRQLVVSSRAGGRRERILGVGASGSIPPSGCPPGWPWVPFPCWSLQEVTPPLPFPT